MELLIEIIILITSIMVLVSYLGYHVSYRKGYKAGFKRGEWEFLDSIDRVEKKKRSERLAAIKRAKHLRIMK